MKDHSESKHDKRHWAVCVYAYCPVSFMLEKRKKKKDNFVDWMKNSNFTME